MSIPSLHNSETVVSFEPNTNCQYNLSSSVRKCEEMGKRKLFLLFSLFQRLVFVSTQPHRSLDEHRHADNLLKNVPSELDNYVIDKELQHTDDLIFYVALLVFSFLHDKIS